MFSLIYNMRIQSKVASEAEVSACIIWLYVLYYHCVVSTRCNWYKVTALQSWIADLAVLKNIQEM